MKGILICIVVAAYMALQTVQALDCNTDTECERSWRQAHLAKHHSH